MLACMPVCMYCIGPALSAAIVRQLLAFVESQIKEIFPPDMQQRPPFRFRSSKPHQVPPALTIASRNLMCPMWKAVPCLHAANGMSAACGHDNP